MRPLTLALDVTGHPSKWITWQEAITYQDTDPIAREMGEHAYANSISRAAGAIGTITTRGIALPQIESNSRMGLATSGKILRPDMLPVLRMSERKPLKTRASELFRTSAGSQFALSVFLRAGYPSGAFTMGSQL